jgi:hypothetical protein
MPDPHEYPKLEVLAEQLAGDIRERQLVPHNVGLAVFLFHPQLLGQGGGLAYVSNAKREDMIATIVDWLGRQIDDGHGKELQAAFDRLAQRRRGE